MLVESNNGNGVIVDASGVEPLVERLVACWHPHQIWLFGSRARGQATDESDWDVLVVLEDGAPDSWLDPVAGWRIGRESRVRADVVTCKRKDFDEDRSTPNTLAFEAATAGLLLHER